MTLATRLALTAASASLFAGAAAAQDFSGAEAIAVEDAIAVVRVEFTDTGPISVDIRNRGERPLSAVMVNGRVVIAGEDDLDDKTFWRLYDGETEGGIRFGPVRIAGAGRSISMQNGENEAFNAMLENYPEVVVTAPSGTDFTVGDSALRLRGEGTAGTVEIDDTIYVIADLGDARRALIGVHGPGRIGLGDVEEALEAGVHGSGDILFGRAGSAQLKVHGSGDIEGSEVIGRTEASVHGSGDIQIGRFGGGLEASVHGSGDIDAGEVEGPLSASVHGSGDIVSAKVNGPVEASVNGSGDIDLGSGEAPRFRASVNGSGDIVFGGTAFDPRLNTSGSGNIEINSASGQISASGRGIRVGGKNYGDRE
jgi:hypothetical protein